MLYWNWKDIIVTGSKYTKLIKTEWLELVIEESNSNIKNRLLQIDIRYVFIFLNTQTNISLILNNKFVLLPIV